jgi:hypothetical protein
MAKIDRRLSELEIAGPEKKGGLFARLRLKRDSGTPEGLPVSRTLDLERIRRLKGDERLTSLVGPDFEKLNPLPLNLNTKDLRQIVQWTKSKIKEETGFVPGDPRLKLPENRKKFFETIISKIAPVFESDEPTSSLNYTRIRNQVRSIPDVDKFSATLMAKGAVCEELAMLGHLLGAEYGIRTTFTTLTLSGAQHAVLRFDGMIADFNYARRIVPEAEYTEQFHPKFDRRINVAGDEFDPVNPVN